MKKEKIQPHTLYAEHLVRRFKKRTVVNDVSFSVSTGQVIGLLGPNGAGKTTSFYMVVGLLFPDQGRVLIDQENITALPMHVRAKQGISYLPQNTSIFRRMTVTENLLSVMEVCGIEGAERKRFLNDPGKISDYTYQRVLRSCTFWGRTATSRDRTSADH